MQLALGDNMKWFLFPMLLALVFGNNASADVSLEVIHSPNDRVLLYSPAVVVFAIVNNESQPVLIPLNWTQNLIVRFRFVGQSEFPPQSSFLHREGKKAVWLHKNDKYYFSISIPYLIREPGEYEIQALLNNQDNCGLFKTNERKYYNARSLLPDQSLPISCWKGSVVSPLVRISLSEPYTTLDKQAFDRISSFFPAPFTNQLIMAYPDLKQLYPLSIYTKIAATYAEDYDFLKDDNSDLRRYAEFERAEKNVIKGKSAKEEIDPTFKPVIDQLKREREELKHVDE
jgi:hypothetical protein